MMEDKFESIKQLRKKLESTRISCKVYLDDDLTEAKIETLEKVRKLIDPIYKYVRSQRTDIQPIFFSRLIRGFKDLIKEIEGE